MRHTRRTYALVALTLGLALLLASAAHAEDSTLRVMSFNIRYATAPDGENAWSKRKDLLLETITKFDPDLLGTQEVLATQVDFLSESLTNYKLVGVGRDDGVRKGEFSAILFKTSRFDVVDSGTFWLSETPDVPGSKSWDSSLPRLATWAKLRDKTDRHQICFLNTHWDHRGNVARVESAKIIRQWISEHANRLPTIVTGDLNVDENHEGYLTLISEKGKPRLMDVFRQLHSKPTGEEASFHNFTGKRAGKRIDFILATPQFTATKATIDRFNKDNRYPSDHFPVEAVLTLSREKDK